MNNPPLALLHSYYTKYLEWSRIWGAEAADDTEWTDTEGRGVNEEARKEMGFVVASVTGGGLGNQLQQTVQGLIMAIRTGRPLVIHAVHTVEEAEKEGITWHKNLAQTYAFNSVLPLLPIHIPRSLGYETGDGEGQEWRDGAGRGHTKFVHLHSAEGLEFVTCANWEEQIRGFQFVKVWAIAEPHLALVNPVEGPPLREAFGDRLFFWLSHFLWSATALPEPEVMLQKCVARMCCKNVL